MPGGASIAAMHCLTPAGVGVDALWEALCRGPVPGGPVEHFTTPRGAPHAGFVAALPGSPAAPGRLRALFAAALETVLSGVEDRGRVGLVLATTDMGGNAFAGDEGELEERYPGLLPRGLGEELGLGGPHVMVSTASASGGTAIGVALDLLRDEELDHVALAAADCITASATHGLDSLRTLSRDGCRPFSAERRGIGIAESSAALLLGGRGSGPRVCASASSNLTTHLAAPQAAGIADALATVLDEAALRPADVALVHVHGAGTRAGDSAEVAALERVFGDRLAALPLLSSKGTLGHLQGAAGLIGALASALCLTQRAKPPTWRSKPRDTAFAHLDLGGRALGEGHAVSLCSGLGGVNNATVLAA
jgi:3-oxoacyl-[acyl-carrier-protein] synthase II